MSSCPAHAKVAGTLAALLCIAGLHGNSASLAAPKNVATFASSGTERGLEPVVLSLGEFPELQGLDVAEIAIYRFDWSALGFVPVAFQVDERFARTFWTGTPYEFVEVVYDVFDEEDGLVDALDEVAFVYKDAGDKAPPDAPWPEGAGPLRYEVEISDPRPGVSSPPRWIYIFLGADLPRSADTYLAWNTLATSSVSTPRFDIEYEDRWLLTGFRVHPPCGSGLDLIDRFKGRAGLTPAHGESEETWNDTSTYLGGIAGPIRAIRYVMGAASAATSVHHDIITPSYWERRMNLRVHPISKMWFYIDWTPDGGMTFFSSDQLGGIAIDGSPDAGVSEDFQEWTVTRGPGGGMMTIHDIPPSDVYQTKSLYFQDDSDYDDATQPDYADDDDAAWGNHGFWFYNLQTSYFEPLFIRIRVYPLCANEGSFALGQQYDVIDANPLEVEPTLQQVSVSPIRSLRLCAEGEDVVLSWDETVGAAAYRIYATGQCGAPRSTWEVAADVISSNYRDEGATAAVGDRCYSVVGVTAEGDESEW